ncbi:hypothetical protein I350_06689 [Cryptococcus amylolentus CBS 6273]|uniref:Phytanoyl-CoA dioxygenase n=1 Tax=Cryptococcus amylolentus CBS 6273 TaxID=1296118 RepID=A0A1E3JGV8_9TREE|nr:hypothetical protein I350_06689 [Cryptococcus amylolentus CBS 6273]
MSSTATTVQEQPSQAGVLKLRGYHQPGWDTAMLQELESKGYTVMKGAIPPTRAKEYEDKAYRWLESFGKGFVKDDKKTWRFANLPAFAKGGLFNRHGVHHEQFAWDIRAEPGLIEAFSKIWGTDELLVSFETDGVNVSLPFVANEFPADAAAPWPHVDQSPRRREKHCIQGIANLAPNGPKDGGLMVLENSLPLYTEFFDTHPEVKPAEGWPTRDSWSYREEDIKWFESKGCRWKKVEAEPGDLILWDSRCVHYGAAATGEVPRVATYVCYKPAAGISPEMLQKKKECLADYSGTTHDPLDFYITGTNARGPLSDDENQQPHEPAVLSERAKKLAGLVPY